MAARTALIERVTKETKVQVSLSLDGGPLAFLPDTDSSLTAAFTAAGISPQTAVTHASQDSATQQIWVWTGVGFADHLLHGLAKHAGWSLRVRTAGDLYSESPLPQVPSLDQFASNRIPRTPLNK